VSERDDRPFHVLGIQQIAIGALDKGPLRALWVDLLGADPVGNYKSEQENVDEDIVSVGEGLGLIEVDLMQPIDPERSPKVHVPTLNHIGLWVDDLRAAVAWLTLKGVRFAPGGIRKGAAGYDVCFIHPKGSDDSPLSGEGVLIELVQAPPSLVAASEDITHSLVGLPAIRD
jgi:lactoylglutathione lyase